jgi:hypothetical protein
MKPYDRNLLLGQLKKRKQKILATPKSELKE